MSTYKDHLSTLLFALCTLLISCPIYTQWYQQSIPVSKPITGIKFIDSLKGWACTKITVVNDTSYIINTTNGGTNWNIQYRAYGTTFASISVIDESIAYVGGYDALNNIDQLLKTTNSGLNWTNLGPPSEPTDLFFINKDSGWYCDDFIGADVRTTTNGGQSWTLRINGMTAATQRLFFLNYVTGWCGTDGHLYKTTDAGQSWISIGNFAEGVRAVFFLNENTGWLGMTNNKIRFTSNGGTNWIVQVPTTGSANVPDIYFYNLLTGWAGSAYLEIYKTLNGGTNWGYQTDTSGSYRISFIDSLKGWSGKIGISHTTNGGGPIFYTGLVSNGNAVPSSYKLYQNYPNPFNPYTTIKLDIYRAGPVSLYIYDILGREMYSIINQNLTTGTYEFNWDSRDYSSGVYVCRVTAEDFTASIKMILAK